MLQPMNCPDCGSPTTELKSTFDGRVFICAQHGAFGISGSAASMLASRDEKVLSEALALARKRQPLDAVPIIMSYDFPDD